MPRRVGNTIVPRNPTTRSPLMRRGGVHQQSKTSQRSRSRLNVTQQAENWQEELELEQSDDVNCDDNQ